MKILSIGTGREWQAFNEQHPNDEIVHVDYMYASVSPELREGDKYLLSSENVFTFLEEYPFKDFEHVEAVRVFEHIPTDKISYLLYLLHCVTTPEAILRIVVPDFLEVASELQVLEENLSCNSIQLSPRMFNRTMVELTTELFNEKSDPHQSIWTKQLAHYYLTMEGYWSPEDFEHIQLDGRDWYLEIFSTKVNKIPVRKLNGQNKTEKEKKRKK